MSVSASILMFGRDPGLLETRGWVLESAGFDVLSVTEFVDFQRAISVQSIDLVILCHTLSTEDCIGALKVAHGIRSQTRFLVMTADDSNCAEAGREEEIGLEEDISPFITPKALIATAKKILEVSSQNLAV